MDIVRCLLLDNTLPSNLWAEATKAACIIMNIRSSKRSPRQTPDEIFSGIKPDISKLRIFGSPVFVHETKPGRGKLDTRSKKCVHLSYDTRTKGYRCYDSNSRKVIISKDVRFLESEQFGTFPICTTYLFQSVALHHFLRWNQFRPKLLIVNYQPIHRAHQILDSPPQNNQKPPSKNNLL
jgi:hypothetical protein